MTMQVELFLYQMRPGGGELFLYQIISSKDNIADAVQATRLKGKNFRIGSLNVGTLRGRASEVVETLSRRKVDICCLQETRYRGGQCRIFKGKNTKYKCYWSGKDKGTGGVGVLLAEEWIGNVFEVRRVSDRIILLRLVVGSSVLTFLSVYAPQVGLSDVVKDQFYDQLRATAAKVPASELLVPCGDWNGHVGRDGTGFREVHGGYGLGVRNVEGERILEFAVANDLVVGNTCFKKRECHLVTYQSGGISTQIDYILFRCNLHKLIVNVKTIPGEECATQHRLLVCDIKVDIPSLPKRKFVPRLKIWKLKDPVTRQKFRVAFTQRTVDANAVTTEEKWANLKKNLAFWVLLKKRAVYHAKSEAEKTVFANIDPKSPDIYRIANQMRRENQDVVGEKPVRNDVGKFSLTDVEKEMAWLQHYKRLLNVEFPWNPDDLSVEDPVEGPALQISTEMVKKAIDKMQPGKAAGPSGIVAEMFKAAGDAGVALIRDLAVSIIRDGRVPMDWEESLIVNLHKGKGDALDRGNYRGLKLTEQALKVLERVVDNSIRPTDIRIEFLKLSFGYLCGPGELQDVSCCPFNCQENTLAATEAFT
ncbi:PREDICTED: uncharacterized protein LOC106811605 [Priapulus caudatus]|uniref:Uncharacterized protein LOC106811605 n=1 Tax=Priapulus caudatus TaxID=37621 RepID=A0ABM1EF21_PRICU|nr:PREDICTED: uncharacterized protein LOC106811605 [Priapulus caudatus]